MLGARCCLRNAVQAAIESSSRRMDDQDLGERGDFDHPSLTAVANGTSASRPVLGQVVREGSVVGTMMKGAWLSSGDQACNGASFRVQSRTEVRAGSDNSLLESGSLTQLNETGWIKETERRCRAVVWLLAPERRGLDKSVDVRRGTLATKTGESSKFDSCKRRLISKYLWTKATTAVSCLRIRTEGTKRTESFCVGF